MPRLDVVASTATTLTLGDGRHLLAFAGCNYLGLAQHPAVLQAAMLGLSTFGVSTTASRETTGNTAVHDALEHDLAAFTSQEAAILTAEGYTANFAVAQGLAHDHGIALIDAKAHRSIRNAATAAGMQVIDYEHNNPESARSLAARYADQGVALFTDGIFAADGAIAPVSELLRALPPKRATLIVDDCHGFCVMGPRGAGTVAAAGLDDPRICITTTLAKGLGCYGGAVLGRRALINYIRAHSDVYRRSTPVPTPIAMAARAALSLLMSGSELLERLRSNTILMRTALRTAGINTHTDPVPVFTFVTGSTAAMQRTHDGMLHQGIYAPLIEYPGGPSDRYFRLTVTAAHTPDDITRCGRALAASVT
jgi:8-amino-7-oxononanoate synthase